MRRIELWIFKTFHYFVRKRFEKRFDGYYCIKKANNRELNCMPETKGRSSSTNETINENSLKILTKLYGNTSLSYNLEKIYNMKFSWLEKYNKAEVNHSLTVS